MNIFNDATEKQIVKAYIRLVKRQQEKDDRGVLATKMALIPIDLDIVLRNHSSEEGLKLISQFIEVYAQNNEDVKLAIQEEINT